MAPRICLETLINAATDTYKAGSPGGTSCPRLVQAAEFKLKDEAKSISGWALSQEFTFNVGAEATGISDATSDGLAFRLTSDISGEFESVGKPCRRGEKEDHTFCLKLLAAVIIRA